MVVLIVNELRSTSIDAEFHMKFRRRFTLKKLPVSAMDTNFHHPDIHVFLLRQRKDGGGQ